MFDLTDKNKKSMGCNLCLPTLSMVHVSHLQKVCRQKYRRSLLIVLFTNVLNYKLLGKTVCMNIKMAHLPQKHSDQLSTLHTACKSDSNVIHFSDIFTRRHSDGNVGCNAEITAVGLGWTLPTHARRQLMWLNLKPITHITFTDPLIVLLL